MRAIWFLAASQSLPLALPCRCAMIVEPENVFAFMLRSLGELAILTFVAGTLFLCLAPSAWF